MITNHLYREPFRGEEVIHELSLGVALVLVLVLVLVLALVLVLVLVLDPPNRAPRWPLADTERLRARAPLR